MFPKRVVLLCALVLFCFSSALAQRPGPQFWRKVTCESFEPRTKLEEIESIPKGQWERGITTDHRQLVSIRQALLARLGLPGDEDRWIVR